MNQAKNTEITLQKGESVIVSEAEYKKKDMAKYLEPEFIRERLQEIDDPQERMFCTFLWMSGLRVSEAVGIKIRHIDIRNKVITIMWLKSRKYNERNVPIHSQLAQMLALFIGGRNKEDKLFPFSRQRAWQITKKYFGCNPHVFRHSFAVNFLRKGGSIVSLYRILGHSKIQTTMEYLKIVPNDLSKELEQIGF